MTIADVLDFYQRRDAFDATGGEEPCTGCDKVLEAGEPFSIYDIAGRERTPRAFPPSINLCQKCTFMVIGSRMTLPTDEPEP
jgi:hypothetical protein